MLLSSAIIRILFYADSVLITLRITWELKRVFVAFRSLPSSPFLRASVDKQFANAGSVLES
jgi:hypothetical protein